MRIYTVILQLLADLKPLIAIDGQIKDRFDHVIGTLVRLAKSSCSAARSVTTARRSHASARRAIGLR
jgi:hypothetical protein